MKNKVIMPLLFLIVRKELIPSTDILNSLINLWVKELIEKQTILSVIPQQNKFSSLNTEK